MCHARSVSLSSAKNFTISTGDSEPEINMSAERKHTPTHTATTPVLQYSTPHTPPHTYVHTAVHTKYAHTHQLPYLVRPTCWQRTKLEYVASSRLFMQKLSVTNCVLFRLCVCVCVSMCVCVLQHRKWVLSFCSNILAWANMSSSSFFTTTMRNLSEESITHTMTWASS